MGKPKKTFNVKLNDGSHELYFDFAALYTFEEIHGQTATRVMTTGDIGFRAVAHLVYAGLLHNEDKISVKGVIDRIDVDKMEQIVSVLVKALEYAHDTGEKSGSEKKAKGRD